MSLVRDEAPLRGIVIRGEQDQLVVQANPDAIARYMAERRQPEVEVRRAVMAVRFGPPTLMTTGNVAAHRAPARSAVPTSTGAIRMSDYLYDAEGRPVAVIESLTYDVAQHEVASMGDVVTQVVRGRATMRITAVGLSGVSVR